MPGEARHARACAAQRGAAAAAARNERLRELHGMKVLQKQVKIAEAEAAGKRAEGRAATAAAKLRLAAATDAATEARRRKEENAQMEAYMNEHAAACVLNNTLAACQDREYLERL